MIELHLQLLDIVLSLRNKELPSVKKDLSKIATCILNVNV